jgi:hypothetical protein
MPAGTAAGSPRDDIVLAWPRAGFFEARAGREIVVEPAPGASVRKLEALLLGPMLAVLLHQRGLFVLHASAVSRRSAAIAFLGGAGAGKSTLAAILCARGWCLVADDFIGVPTSVPPIVSPAFPLLKLWPPAVRAFAASAPRTPLHEDTDKAVVGRPRAFRGTPVRLGRLYVLARGDRAAIEPMGPAEQVAALMQHTYGPQTLYAAAPAVHFSRCASLAATVPVRRLVVPRSLAALGDVAPLLREQDGAAA